ncbi:hypothetical protein EZ054_03125 [Enterococcus faecalis]|uniref:hypothetical protein n=1 Tax=Enterococcus TaxID=1350 RepID=UPI0001B2B48C|nr:MULTISPECIES: hypothetical protein [Enterococcus]EEU63904.1 predicted protein [Enterococcus faecalis DS5]EFT47848.1 hypothetical protein HMPREF9501_01442 [Enterococcus faecalis TX0027]EGO5852141.1 hypothetical protein [Enterococcus faecalis]EGO9398542.1 hypothetical protein [Enterococcus faecalis]EIA6620968.1 hypothetical protein [Enterococcus faecalis]
MKNMYRLDNIVINRLHAENVDKEDLNKVVVSIQEDETLFKENDRVNVKVEVYMVDTNILMEIEVIGTIHVLEKAEEEADLNLTEYTKINLQDLSEPLINKASNTLSLLLSDMLNLPRNLNIYENMNYEGTN